MNQKNDRLEMLACDMECRYGPDDLVVLDIRSAMTDDDECLPRLKIAQRLRNQTAKPSRYGRLHMPFSY